MKATVDNRWRLGGSLLLEAVERGRADLVKVLLDRGDDPEQLSKDDNRPLHLAVTGLHVEVVQLLLAAGVDVNSCGKGGNRALHLAFHATSDERQLDAVTDEIITSLLCMEACPNALGPGGTTPLHLAVAAVHLGIATQTKLIDDLCNCGARTTIASLAGLTPLEGVAFLPAHRASAVREALSRWAAVDWSADLRRSFVSLVEPWSSLLAPFTEVLWHRGRPFSPAGGRPSGAQSARLNSGRCSW